MAEQSISLPVTPKSTDLDAGNSKSNSMGKASSSKSGGNIPNYLRASTGSCHDFCKYGKKHEFEEKARRPFLRRNAKKPPDEENSLEFEPEKNRRLQVKHKPNSNSETPPKTPEILKWRASPKSLQRQSLSSADTAAKKMSSRVLFTKSADRQSPVLREILAKKKTVAREVLTESSDSQKSVSSQNWVDRRKGSAQERKKTATREVLTKSVDSQSSISGENSVERRKTSIVKLGTSADSKTRLSPKIMKQDSSSPPEILKVSWKHASSKVKEENISAKCTSSFELKLSSPGSSKVLNVGGNSDSKIGKKTVTSKIAGKRVQTSSRALLSPNSSGSGIVRGQVNQRASLSLKPTLKLQMSPRVLLSSKTSSTGIVRGLPSPGASITLKSSLSRVASQNARKHGGSEVVFPLTNQSKIEKANNEHPKINQADPDQSTEELEGPNNDVAQEKTLYVIKMETENKVLESDHKKNLSPELSPPPLSSAKFPSLPESPLSSSHNEEDEEESEYTATDAEDNLVSEYDEMESTEETDPPGVQKGRLGKAGVLHSEDKNDQPVKLQFRRGRVIDIQTEHSRPRRLKFRQGRAIGNQNLKADGRRSFKKREADGHATDSKRNSEKVVLRHQDAQGKKDAQGLFNNVIEETASKLVETRKSKVKALVGAFETVISLQDGKPTANTAS